MAAKRKASVLLHKESASATTSDTLPEPNPDDTYAGFMKDADKLKLMLLAWNYQNSNAVRNGANVAGVATPLAPDGTTPAPDLGVVSGLWAQYQNALAMNVKQPPVSPLLRTEPSASPIENQDETNSSGQKDDEDVSEDDSDDKIDTNSHDPERLKAFNMFVRLFVDENLDRMVPISKQPKEKIQAIIDSCARQFPEFSERSRKRIRTYLKSCRRNKKTREGWENTSRPTPAHLTSVQAEQILALACENESMNAKRMRVGLDPISQSLPINGTLSSNPPIDTIAPTLNTTTFPGYRSNDIDISVVPTITTSSILTTNTTSSSPLALNSSNVLDVKNLTNVLSNGMVNSQNNNNITNLSSNTSINTNGTSPLYRPGDFASPNSTTSSYPVLSNKTPNYPAFFPTNPSPGNVTPTDLSMKNNNNAPQSIQTSLTNGQPPTSISPNRPPIFGHKLNANEITAARQVISAYRESAAFLLRTADQVEQLLIQQQ